MLFLVGSAAVTLALAIDLVVALILVRPERTR
jgi:hypothetical protein